MGVSVSPEAADVLRAVAAGRVEYRWRSGRVSDHYTLDDEDISAAARPLARRGLIWHPPGTSRPRLSPAAMAWVADHPASGPDTRSAADTEALGPGTADAAGQRARSTGAPRGSA